MLRVFYYYILQCRRVSSISFSSDCWNTTTSPLTTAVNMLYMSGKYVAKSMLQAIFACSEGNGFNPNSASAVRTDPNSAVYIAAAVVHGGKSAGSTLTVALVAARMLGTPFPKNKMTAQMLYEYRS